MMVTAIEYVAVIANILFVWPQTYKVYRWRNFNEVSASTWTISLVLFIAWSLYAFHLQYWSLLIANVSCSASTLGLVILAVVTRQWNVRWLLSVSAVSAFLVAVTVTQPAVLGFMLIVAGIAVRTPQIFSLWRSDPDTQTGFSVSTWMLSLIVASSWLFVSVSTHNYTVAAANLVSLSATIVLLAVYWLKQGAVPNVRGVTVQPTD